MWALALALLIGAPADVPAGAVVVTRAVDLQAALADQIVWCKLNAADLDETQQAALRAWVAGGGTLWTETDLAGLFGYRYQRLTDVERIGHGRRASPAGAAPLMTGVEDVFYRFAADDVLLVSHPSALPLLRVIDAAVDYQQPRFAAALLYYGLGNVIHRPAEVHQQRCDGARFSQQLAALSRPDPTAVVVPAETLQVCWQRARDAADKVRKEPDAAKQIAYQVFLAFRLWYAEHLTGTGQFDEALRQLSAVAADLPDDPAVYLAVAKLNDKLGRTVAAQSARQKAAARYAELKRTPPDDTARQVRVPWPVFVESLNAAGRAFETPSSDACRLVAGRVAWALGLEAYQRYDLKPANQLWVQAAQDAPGWPLPAFWSGLLQYSSGEGIRQPNRTRTTLFGQAQQWFTRAAQATPNAEFDPQQVANAAAWADAAAQRRTELANEPPDATVSGHFVLRYDAADRRLQVGPLFEMLGNTFAQSYAATTRWGVYLDDTEVLVYYDSNAMRSALPGAGAVDREFISAATVGRRIYTAARATDAGRIARHEFTHAVSNALTEGGFPAPLWFEEGLASAMEENPTRSQLALVNLRRGRALSIQQLSNPELFYHRDYADQAYGQSELMVEALTQRFGSAVLLRFLSACGWGTAPDQALRGLTGLNQEQFLAAYLQGRLGKP